MVEWRESRWRKRATISMSKNLLNFRHNGEKIDGENGQILFRHIRHFRENREKIRNAE